jgi:hypothetical protein
MLSDTVRHAHIGFYVYDGYSYMTRDAALDAMLLKCDYDATIQFYYNDHIYGNMNWEREVIKPISDLYKERAQQIRDKYKYLILNFSGGSDSTQVLESFLKNGIFLDEIVVAMQEKLVAGVSDSELLSNKSYHQFLEYRYAVIPMLNKIKKLSPNTKITVIDTSDDLHTQIINKHYDYIGQRFVIPQLPKITVYSLRQFEKNNSKDGIAVIRGFEKPVIIINDDGKIFHAFNDVTMSGSQDVQTQDSPYTFEDFFWTPDLPLITIKQCQMIIKALSNYKNFYNAYKVLHEKIVQARNDKTMKGSPSFVLERLYNTIIYPDWNPNTFVAPKITKSNPDFDVLNKLNFKSEVDMAKEYTEEFTRFKSKRYEKIVNKQQLSRLIFSRSYYLGQFKPNF